MQETGVRSLGQEDPLVEGMNTPVFLSGASRGQRSLVGYSPWGAKSRTWLSACPGHLGSPSCSCNSSSVVAKLCLTLVTPWTVACPWDSPGKNAGVGCHFLLQGIFLTQESSIRLLHYEPTIQLLLLKHFLFLNTLPLLPRLFWSNCQSCHWIHIFERIYLKIYLKSIHLNPYI